MRNANTTHQLPSPFTVPEPHWTLGDDAIRVPDDWPVVWTVGEVLRQLSRFAHCYADPDNYAEDNRGGVVFTGNLARDATTLSFRRAFLAIPGFDQLRTVIRLRYGLEVTVESVNRLVEDCIRASDGTFTISQAEQLEVSDVLRRLNTTTTGSQAASTPDSAITALLTDPSACPECRTPTTELDRAAGGMIPCRHCGRWELDTGIALKPVVGGHPPVRVKLHAPFWQRLRVNGANAVDRANNNARGEEVSQNCNKQTQGGKVGRKPIDPAFDKRVWDAWQTRRYPDYASLARELNCKKKEVEKAIDRMRKKPKPG
jgi:hypothetical protein